MLAASFRKNAASETQKKDETWLTHSRPPVKVKTWVMVSAESAGRDS